MTTCISLRLDGAEETLSPSAFTSAVKYFSDTLQELDTSISNNPRGTVRWSIEALTKSSPAVVTFSAQPMLSAENYAPKIQEVCLSGVRQLTERADWPSQYSDAALSKLNSLAKLHCSEKRSGLSLIEIVVNGQSAAIGPDTCENIQRLTGEGYESMGSIVGNLDAITVHQTNEFRVWEEVTQSPVRCRFEGMMLQEITNALGRRVLVYGSIKTNYRGQKTSIQVHGLELYPDESELPSIEDMSGLVDDFTGGLELGDYIESVRYSE